MKPANGISADESRVIVDAIVRFCATAGRACYGAYSGEVLRDYVEFHLQHETMAWTREGDPTPGGWKITGAAVAWQCDPEEMFRANGQTRCVFNWRPTNPCGRALFIADVVCTTRKAVLAMVQAFSQRFPNWHTMPLYTYRRGRLVYVTPNRLTRLYRRLRKLEPALNSQPSTKD